MAWKGALLMTFVLVAQCYADYDVSLSNSCGKTVIVGEYSVNGYVNLFSEDKGVIPDDCEVTLVAGKGLSLHLRLVSIDSNCNEVIQVTYEQSNGIDEVAFFSFPHFCGKTIEDESPIPLVFDVDTNACKIRFSRGNKDDGMKSGFQFDYTTRPLETEDDLIWPIKPTSSAPMTTTEDFTTSDAAPTEDLTTSDAAPTEDLTTSNAASTEDLTTSNAAPTKDFTTSDAAPTEDLTTSDAAPTEHLTTSDSAPTEHFTTSNAASTEDLTTSDAAPTEDLTTSNAAPTKDFTTSNAASTEDFATSTAASTEDFATSTAAPIKDFTTSNAAPTEDFTTSDVVVKGESSSTMVENSQTTTSADIQTTFAEKSTPATKATKFPPIITAPPQKPTESFQCTCSLGFERDGSHQLLREFPNVLPQSPYVIKVLADLDQPCTSVQQKCDDFCKLFVETRVNGIGGLKQIVVRQDFLKFLKIPAALRPKLQATLGDFVCEDYTTKLSGSGAELHAFSHVLECGSRPNEVQLIEKSFCCDGKGKHVECAPPPQYPCNCMLTVNNNYNYQFIGTALPKPINITISSTDDCNTATVKCMQYCKGTSQYKNLIRGGSNTYSYTNKGQFSTSTIGKAVGDRICAVERYIRPSQRARLLVTADLKTCTNKSSSYVASLDSGAYFCCSNNRYTKCDSSFPTTKRPIYVTKSTPYYSTPSKAKSIICQCVPIHFNGTGGNEKRFPAATTTTVAFTAGCFSAQYLCKQSCTRFVVKPTSGLPLNTALVNGIKNNVCRRIYSPLYTGVLQSQLKMYSVLDNSKCQDSRYRSFIRTLDSDFCCTGGTSSYYKSCKSLSLSPVSTYRPSYTTKRPYYSTYKPAYSTSKPAVRIYRYSCECSVGLRYSGYASTFQYINAKDVSTEFSSSLNGATTRYSCTTIRNSCRSMCQSRMDRVVNAKTTAYTPYGRVGINSAICRKMARSITLPIDFFVRSKPSLCGNVYTTGKFYDLNFCCTKYGTTSTCQKNVVG